MAIAVGQTSRYNVAYGASRNITFGSAPAASDLVLLSLFCETNAAITVPSGFTTLGDYTNTGATQHSVLAYKYGDTSNSYTFSWTGDAIYLGWGMTFTGVDSTTPIDVVAGAWDEDNFAALQMASVTTATDLALHVLATYHSNGNAGAAITGYTRYFASEGSGREVVYVKEISPAGSTGANTVDFGTEYYCHGLSFALRPVAAATKGFPFPSRAPMAHLLVR